MKKLLTKIIAVGTVALMVFASCKKDETRVVETMGSPGALTASDAAPSLSLATAANTAVTFSWTATPTTGYKALVAYTVQIGVKGKNFANAQEIVATAVSQSVTVGDLNKALLALNLTIGTSADIEVRVKSALATNYAIYSNVVTLTVTPYSLVSYIYVPGAYQGWAPASATTLSSPTSNGVYDGTVTFTDPASLEFKITPAPTWDVSYGGAGGVLSTSGPNLSVPTIGTYAIHVDMNALTYTLTKQ